MEEMAADKETHWSLTQSIENHDEKKIETLDKNPDLQWEQRLDK